MNRPHPAGRNHQKTRGIDDIPEIGREQVIKALDLAVLKPNARLEDVTNAARVVEDMGLASLCVASYNVAVAKQITSRLCSVIGFPHGNMLPRSSTWRRRQRSRTAPDRTGRGNQLRPFPGRPQHGSAAGTRSHCSILRMRNKSASRRSWKRATTSQDKS